MEATKIELVSGYEKIKRFYKKTGGFGELNNDDGDEKFSGYCLMMFYQMVNYHMDFDMNIYAETYNWLKGRNALTLKSKEEDYRSNIENAYTFWTISEVVFTTEKKDF